MSHETTASATRRVSISCPGCGRHDTVSWPQGASVYHWKCFNCGKEYDLSAKKGH
jgi:Zn ribbon nucleic-acid-binding protein